MPDLLKWIFALFDTSSLETEETNYICLQCGAGFERDHHNCLSCDCQFVAPVDDHDESHSDP